MTMTPAVKGLLTKAVKANPTTTPGAQLEARFRAVRKVFVRAGLPSEQAKHATRKYLAA